MSVIALAFDHLPEIVSVLSDAFHDYPVMRYTLGPDVTDAGAPYDVRLHRLVQLFVSGRAYRSEPMLGVRDEAGRLVAAAVMSWPAATDPPPPQFIALRESIWAELGVDVRTRYDAYTAAANFFADFPPHYHLNMIGVRRSHHGLGLARTLLAAVHDVAERDERSIGVSLTTERSANVALYEHFGYRVQGHARVAAELETWGLFRGTADRTDRMTTGRTG